MSYKDLNVTEVEEFIQQPNTIVIDIRDIRSYQAGHLENALHIDGPTMSNLIRSREKHPSVLIYCYHGNSSRDMAGIISRFGFSNVSHLVGGWAAWERHKNQSDKSEPLFDEQLGVTFA